VNTQVMLVRMERGGGEGSWVDGVYVYICFCYECWCLYLECTLRIQTLTTCVF